MGLPVVGSASGALRALRHLCESAAALLTFTNNAVAVTPFRREPRAEASLSYATALAGSRLVSPRYSRVQRTSPATTMPRNSAYSPALR